MNFSTVRQIAVLATAIAIAAPVAAAAEGAKEVQLGAKLTGSEEVNAQGKRDQGAVHGSGVFTARLSAEKGQLCYDLTLTGLEGVSMAHIHSGAAGTNGPVYVNLPELGQGEHCVPLSKAEFAALSAAPKDYYVNVHSAEFPAGAVRGQLVDKSANDATK